MDEKVPDYLITIGVKKASQTIVKFIITMVASAEILSKFGVTIDQSKFDFAMTTLVGSLLAGGIAIIRNFVKHKWKIRFF